MKDTTAKAIMIFCAGIIVGFIYPGLCFAAGYYGWYLPYFVMLLVALGGVMGVMLGATLHKLYCQFGLLYPAIWIVGIVPVILYRKMKRKRDESKGIEGYNDS